MERSELSFIEMVVLWGIYNRVNLSNMSSSLNVSRDELNKVIENLINKGYLKKEQVNDKIKYFLTAKGFNSLSSFPGEVREYFKKPEEIKEQPQQPSSDKQEVLTIRPASITVASILFYIFGILGIIGSLILLGGGSILYGVPYVGWLTGGVFIAFGIIGLIISILDILAGYWLWHSLRKGGIIGIIVCVLSIIVSIPELLIPSMAALTGVSILIDIVLIILIGIGWKSLK